MATTKKLNPNRPLTGNLAYLDRTPEYSVMARIWRDKPFGNFRFVDWELIEKLGFKTQLEYLLSYPVHDMPFRLEAFKRLFSIDEPVYMEMVTEVMTTYAYQRGSTTDDSVVSFRYLGKPFSLTLSQFAQYLGLYTAEEAQTPLFTDGVMDVSTSIITADAWAQWSSTPYFSGIKATRLKDPVLQILHKLLACSLDGKYTTSGRVSEYDVALMTCLQERKNIQVAHLVAQRILVEKSFGERQSYMGPIITRLIRGMGMLRSSEVARFTSAAKWSAKSLDSELLSRMKVIKILTDGTTFICARQEGPITSDRLIPGLRLTRGPKKRKPTRQEPDSDSGDDYDAEIPPLPIPPQDRAGPSTPAPRVQAPVYVYHAETPPDSEYYYWMMLMQMRLYRAKQQEQRGLPVSPLPDIPCVLGRPPARFVTTAAPARPPRPIRIPRPRMAAPQPPRPPVQPVPEVRRSIPSVVGSYRGHLSRDTRRSRAAQPATTAQSHQSHRTHRVDSHRQPTNVIMASTHGQTELFQVHSQQQSPGIPMETFGMPSEGLVDRWMEEGIFTDDIPMEQPENQPGSAAGTQDQDSDSSSDETSPAPMQQ